MYKYLPQIPQTYAEIISVIHGKPNGIFGYLGEILCREPRVAERQQNKATMTVHNDGEWPLFMEGDKPSTMPSEALIWFTRYFNN